MTRSPVSLSQPIRSVRMVFVVMFFAVGSVACGVSPTQAPSTSVTPSAASTAPASAIATPSGNATPSGTASPSGGDVGLDACSLLPTALLSEVLGGEIAFTTAVPSGGWAAAQCAWNGETSSFIVRVGTPESITAFGDSAAPDAKALFAAFKRQADGSGDAKEVPGIGDGAVFIPGGMAAYRGGTYVEVTRLRLTDEQLVDIMRMLIANI